jgi:hypothetical protein
VLGRRLLAVVRAVGEEEQRPGEVGAVERLAGEQAGVEATGARA